MIGVWITEIMTTAEPWHVDCIFSLYALRKNKIMQKTT